jgi:hypothetical protein
MSTVSDYARIHPNKIFSLPTSITVTPEQLQTPNLDTTVNNTAYIHLSNLSEKWLTIGTKTGKLLRNMAIVSITVMTGLRVFTSFPLNRSAFAISATTLAICLIADKFFKKEQKKRIGLTCLELEHQFQIWQKSCKLLEITFKNFQNHRTAKTYTAFAVARQQALDQMYDYKKALEPIVEQLKIQHTNLFGSKRIFDKGVTQTDSWIREGLLSNHQLLHYLTYLKTNNEIPLNKTFFDDAIPLKDKDKDKKLITYFDYTMKSFKFEEIFNKMSECIETSRASVAAFRSTLHLTSYLSYKTIF